MVGRLQSFLAQCVTPLCSQTVSAALASNLALLRSVSVVCVNPVCQQNQLAAVSAQQVWAGAPGAVQAELVRLDNEMEDASRMTLYSDTLSYFSCLTDACRGQAAQQVNTSFAIHGYIRIAKSKGLQVQNMTAWSLFFQQVDIAYLPCALNPCDGTNFTTLRNNKRAYFAAMKFVDTRLAVLEQNCVNTCDRTGLLAARSLTQNSLYIAANYMPFTINIVGMLIYGLIVLACVLVLALAIGWEV